MSCDGNTSVKDWSQCSISHMNAQFELATPAARRASQSGSGFFVADTSLPTQNLKARESGVKPIMSMLERQEDSLRGASPPH